MTVDAPTWDRYCGDPTLAGPFENKVLYAMCRDNPGHTCAYVTAGKITAIGRIYAASPERGAGFGRTPGVTLADAIGKHLAKSRLDAMLDNIGFGVRFSTASMADVVEVHEHLVTEISAATETWSRAADGLNWRPRNQASFASKYLHFHRPNAFPIMDSYAKAGLRCARLKGSLKNYDGFCACMANHVISLAGDWTLRSVDTVLVANGRVHADSTQQHCKICNIPHRNRKRLGMANQPVGVV